MRNRTKRQPVAAPDKRGIERMWRTVSDVYLLGHHTPECFGLLCDLERALHGEHPLRWELVPRYRELMRGVEGR